MTLPPAEDLQSLVVRTDFSDDSTWRTVTEAISDGTPPFQAYVRFVDDRRYDGLTIDGLLELVPPDSQPYFVFLVDSETVTNPEHPILVVDLLEERGRSFRALPRAMWDVQPNLYIANAGFEEYIDQLEDGVYRGFDP